MKKTTKPKATKKEAPKHVLTVKYNDETQTISGDTIAEALASFKVPAAFKTDVDVFYGNKVHIINIRKARQVFGGNRNALAVFSVNLNRRIV